MRYEDRQPLKAGYYWEMATGTIVHVRSPQMGDRRKRYLRIPVFLFIPLAPVLGLFYITALPLVGLVMLIAIVAKRLARGIRSGARAIFLRMASTRGRDGGL